MKQKFELPPEVHEHFEAFCCSFLAARVRDRKLARPDEMLNDLCHLAFEMVRPRACLPLMDKMSNRTDVLLTLLRSLTSVKTAAYMSPSSDYENSICPFDEAVQRLRLTNAVLISIEPGRLVFYATEGCPQSDWYLLSDDPERLAKAAQLATKLANAAHRRSEI